MTRIMKRSMPCVDLSSLCSSSLPAVGRVDRCASSSFSGGVGGAASMALLAQQSLEHTKLLDDNITAFLRETERHFGCGGGSSKRRCVERESSSSSSKQSPATAALEAALLLTDSDFPASIDENACSSAAVERDGIDCGKGSAFDELSALDFDVLSSFFFDNGGSSRHHHHIAMNCKAQQQRESAMMINKDLPEHHRSHGHHHNGVASVTQGFQQLTTCASLSN